MDPSIQRISLVNLLTSALLVGVASTIAFYTGSKAAMVSIAYLGVGLLIAVVAFFQIRLRSREEQERLEYQGMVQSAQKTGLFASDEEDVLIAKRSRAQFERFMVPFFTILIVVAEIAAGLGFWFRLDAGPERAVAQPLVGLAIFGVVGVGTLLLGRYTASLAKIQNHSILRAVASQTLLGAYLLFLSAIALAGSEIDFAALDLYIGKTLAAVLLVLALETALTLVFEVYRPRVEKAFSERVLYESRLVGLFSRPEGIFTTAAHTLDYQFGFKVSETWLYRFFERTLGWILLIQAGLLFAFTSIVIVEPTEQALLERWGKPSSSRPILEPGIHFKAPWPIDKVYRHRTEQVQNFYVGYNTPNQHDEEALLWTTPHQMEGETKPSEFLVASAQREARESGGASAGRRTPPVNLLVANIPIQFQIQDLTQWVYNHSDSARTLESIAYRETTKYLASVDFLEVMSSDLGTAAAILTERIQEAANEVGLGAHIVFVGLQGIHPSIDAASSFQEVVAAQQEKEAMRLEALAYEARLVPGARAEAAKTRYDAEIAVSRRVGAARGASERFASQLAGYVESPEVYRSRAYLDTFSESISGARVLINAVDGLSNFYELDLKDNVRDQMLEAALDNPSEE